MSPPFLAGNGIFVAGDRAHKTASEELLAETESQTEKSQKWPQMRPEACVLTEWSKLKEKCLDSGASPGGRPRRYEYHVAGGSSAASASAGHQSRAADPARARIISGRPLASLGFLGVVYSLAVPTIAWIKQSVLFILISVALVSGIAMTYSSSRNTD
jgi:hypothetical protein